MERAYRVRRLSSPPDVGSRLWITAMPTPVPRLRRLFTSTVVEAARDGADDPPHGFRG